MKTYKVALYNKGRTPANLHTVCPHCGVKTLLSPLEGSTDRAILPINEGGVAGHIFVGLRKCLEPECSKLIFVVYSMGNNVIKNIETYPPQKINFNRNKIPSEILATLDEAIECLANNCCRASAVMIRKTLEEVCGHFGHTKGNLEVKIDALKDQLLIPKGLIDGLHSIRYLGNDAAHIDLRTFDEIGKMECEIGIHFTIKLLEALFQYQELVEGLEKLKKK